MQKDVIGDEVKEQQKKYSAKVYMHNIDHEYFFREFQTWATSEQEAERRGLLEALRTKNCGDYVFDSQSIIAEC